MKRSINREQILRPALFLFAMMSFCLGVSAQSLSITGTVWDETDFPIIGANVIIKGTTTGTVTDYDGNFTLNDVPDGSILTFSYIGMTPQDIEFKGQKSLKIVLVEDTKVLNELVVVGFGSQKKENLTGAVSQVKMSDVLGDRPVTNAMSALQGTMPGLQISGGSSPGQSKSFNIRGTTSINGGSPLVLIDNVPGDIDMLNPEDIESVSILKDAASAAIYGARGAFGVILVTTKKGKKGENIQINYNNNFGFQSSINRTEQATATQYLKAYADAQFNSGKYWTGQDINKWMEYLTLYKKDPTQFKTYGDGVYTDEDGVNYYLNEKNLYNNMLEDYGFMQSHNISAAGGTEKVSYRFSLGYNDQKGILYTDKDSYKRLSASSYVSADLTPWLNQSIDVRFSRSHNNLPYDTQGTLYKMNQISLYPEGELTLADGSSLTTNTPRNILINSGTNNTIIDNPRILSKTTIKPMKGFDVAFEYTFDKKVYDNKRYNAPYAYTTIELSKKLSATNSIYENTKYTTDYNAINLYGSYGFNVKDDHNFKVMAGFNQESSDKEQLYVKQLNMINEDKPSISGGTGETTAKDTYTQYAVRGAFYRLNYDYKGRYLVETNGRYDGSSKFPTKNRFGFFPSLSLGWNVAQESFMKPTQNWLGEFKLRASWGQVGNQAIDPYQYMPEMDAVLADWIINGQQPTTLTKPGLVSDNFTWETVETLDFGFDASMFNNRLRTTFDWYIRDTKDMLAPGLELPGSVGAEAPLQNVADLKTKGWELSLSWRDKIGKVGYNIGLNLYDSQTEVTKYNNASGVITNSSGSNNYYTGYKVGQIWGYVSDGYYTVDDFTDLNTWTLKDGVASIQGVNVRPGDVKFKNLRDDANSKNQIDAGNSTLENLGDRTIIGNSQARYQYGISAGVNYKGFDLSFLFNGVGKRDYWASGDRIWGFNEGRFGTIFSDQLDYWQPIQTSDPSQPGYYEAINPNAKFFRIYNERENSNSNTRTQSGYLLDASYLRLKNVTLSYTFPKTIVEKFKLGALKAFVSGENLGTWTSLPSGYDPERLSWGYPFYRTISFGVNVTL
ncbi:MAG: TonB-dependent receptor [Bacteroidales bacterium]|nr:TonB-dependent receptor [Bacteroidales bacterium]